MDEVYRQADLISVPVEATYCVPWKAILEQAQGLQRYQAGLSLALAVQKTLNLHRKLTPSAKKAITEEIAQFLREEAESTRKRDEKIKRNMESARLQGIQVRPFNQTGPA